jgi:hypothetical protein
MPMKWLEIVGKKSFATLSTWMIRLSFLDLCWHITQGRIPTCPGIAGAFYTYPIINEMERS